MINLLWRHFVLVLYLCLLLLTLLYIYLDIKREYFETATTNTAQQNQNQQTCFKCMDFYQDILVLTNPSEIVPYVKMRSQFIQNFIDKYAKFIKEDVYKCPKKGDKLIPSELISCFTATLNELLKKCQEEKRTYAECVVSKTLGERILKDASICGKSTCTSEEFMTNFQKSIDKMKADFYDCQMAFQKTDDECVKTYTAVINQKTGAPLKQVEDENVPMTRKEINEKLGDVATFAMTMT